MHVTQTRIKRISSLARQAAILDAAYDQFAKHGFSDTRIEDVARGAGVSKGSIYLYFPTKEALFEALVRRDMAPRAQALAQFLGQYNGPLEPLFMQGAQIAATMFETRQIPIYPKLLIAESQKFPQLARFYRQEIAGIILKALSDLLARAQLREEISIDAPEVTAHLFMAPFFKSFVWHFTFGPIEDEPLDIRTHLTSHVKMFMRAIAPSKVMP